MIAVELSQIEKITDMLLKASSDTDETVAKLHALLSQMQEDIVFRQQMEYPAVTDALTDAISPLERACEMLQRLKAVMEPVADDYRQIEQQHIRVLGRMSAVASAIKTGLDVTVKSDNIPAFENGDESERQAKVQKLVAENAQTMELTNIAAITQTVKEEYEPRGVKELPEDKHEA